MSNPNLDKELRDVFVKTGLLPYPEFSEQENECFFAILKYLQYQLWGHSDREMVVTRTAEIMKLMSAVLFWATDINDPPFDENGNIPENKA